MQYVKLGATDLDEYGKNSFRRQPFRTGQKGFLSPANCCTS